MYLKDKLDDDELDISMMQLTDIPVKDIEKLGNKVLKLNISLNLLTSIPANLPFLAHLTAIDLSKNQIKELPENFGQLVKLRSLDLYCNDIERLPVSFAQLKSLKWLDLKENPLVPELAKAAGPCITKTDCEQAAKRVVARLQSIESQLFQEKMKRLEAEERLRKQREKAEEIERERLRAEKKAAKERRREEARAREAENRDQFDGDRNNVQINGMSSPKKTVKNGRLANGDLPASNSGISCFGFLLKLMFILSIGIIATGILLLWVYTDGKMDSDSIQLAVPIIQKDVESHIMSFGKKSEKMYKKWEKAARPYAESTIKRAGTLYKETNAKVLETCDWLEKEYGDSVRQSWSILQQKVLEFWQLARVWMLDAWEILKQWAAIVWMKCQQLQKDAKPTLERLWRELEPKLKHVGEVVAHIIITTHQALQTNIPVYLEWLKVHTILAYNNVYDYIQQLVA